MAFSDDDVNTWTEIAATFYHDTVPVEFEKQSQHAAGMLISGSGLFDAPSEIIDMFEHLIQAGYAYALRDVQAGDYDDEIVDWRPDLHEQ